MLERIINGSNRTINHARKELTGAQLSDFIEPLYGDMNEILKYHESIVAEKDKKIAELTKENDVTIKALQDQLKELKAQVSAATK